MTAINKIYPIASAFLDLTARYERALEESGGEVTPEVEKIQALLINSENAATDIANAYLAAKNERVGEEVKIKALIEELELDLSHQKKREEWLKQILERVLPPGPHSEVCNEQINIFYSESTRVDVFDSSEVPIELCEVKTVPDKDKIKAALKSGAEVPGAKLLINYHLNIKHPGPRAEANARARQKKRNEKNVDNELALGE